jgi:hypothetical protein
VPDTSSKRHPASRNAGKDFTLEAEVLPATGLRQHALNDALRLLATWAVRAARAHAAKADST